MKKRTWFAQFFNKEKLTEQAKSGKFSEEDYAKVEAACQKEFGLSFSASLDAMALEDTQTASLQANHVALLQTLTAETVEDTQAAAANVTDPITVQAAQTVVNQRQTIEAQQRTIEQLGSQAEVAIPGKIVALNVVPANSTVHNKTHLFSIDHPFFALNKPWNAIAAKRQPLETIAAQGLGFKSDWNRYKAEFQAEFTAYANSVSNRMAELQAENKLQSLEFKATALDFTGFDGTDVGNGHIVRRQDALIAYFRSLPSIRNIFPVIYGVQDKMVMTNSFLDDLSQAYQPGKVFKGENKFQPMLAEVFDAMFKHKFSDLKQLEREYIGYYNRENSDPIKWTMIEWLMVGNAEKLNSEWNGRRINGYRIDPATGVAGHYLHASDGIKRKLFKYAYQDFRILPFTDINTYTSSTIGTVFTAIAEKLNVLLPSLEGYALHFNAKHAPWYMAWFRSQFGKDFDFVGGKMTVMNYPNLQLVPVPNMGNSCFLWVTMPGNIELYENQAGEMQNFYFERELEELMVCSWWKEGVGAYKTGPKFASYALLAANSYKDQFIFMNEPVVPLAADATTCDATKGEWFKTVANSAATVLTDIVGAEDGVVYRFEIGHATNATTISKAGKFSTIPASVALKAVGDFWEGYYTKSTGKFTEVAKLVTP